MRHEATLRLLYAAFNARDIDGVLAGMAADVDWPNGWEGGRIVGRDAVRDYWVRQWATVDPSVEPVALIECSDGSVDVTVRQVVRDMVGKVLSEQILHHVFSFDGGVVREMNIEE